jgi:hypothetical protein
VSVALLRVLRFRLTLLWAASLGASVLILGDECVHVELAGCGGLRRPWLIARVEERLKRTLSEDERLEIDNELTALLQATAAAARQEVFTDFQRKFLSRLNEIVVPAVLRREGLGFDFSTLRRLWAMAQEFQIAWATSAHPQHEAWLIEPGYRGEVVDSAPDPAFPWGRR